jgi:leucine-rich repeat protein SHOC2
VSTNKIPLLPPAIATMTGLRTLDLSSNNLSSLPREVGAMTHLQLLRIEGNLIRSIPRSTIIKGTPAILDYIRTRTK